MSHHSSSVNGEGTSHKDPQSIILDELSSLKLWKEKLKKKENRKETVEINLDEREQIREEERGSSFLALRIHLKSVGKIVSVKKIQAEALP